MLLKKKVQIIFASILGNTLEFYNLTLYGVLASHFASLYFPSENKIISLISSLAAFAAAFLVRPLGALIFGHIGDKMGRKKALGLSILCMGIPTIIIGLLPGYEKIGIIAPVILLLCRVAQGLCAGGEFNGAIIFALEHTEKERPGLVGGLIISSCLLGSIMAIGSAALVMQPHFPHWGWRAAFILGGLGCFFGYYIRKFLEESPAFSKLENSKRTLRTPLKSVLSKHLGSFWQVFSIGALDGILTYTLIAFFSVYLVNYLEISAQQAAYYSLAGFIACMIGCPFFGWYADKFTARETLILSCILVFGLCIPVFMALNANMWFSILFGHVLFGFLVSSIIGVQPLFSQSLFPTQDRYTGVSLAYSTGIGIMGGLSPLLLTAVTEYHSSLLAPSFYLMGAVFLFLAMLLVFRKK